MSRARVRGRGRPAYHLKVRRGELPPTVLLPGDPARAERIASTWETAEPLHESREYRSYRGRLRGVPLGVVSAGIGGPSAAIVIEELARAGVRTVLRVGSCGAIDPRLKGGDVAITLAAARFEATSLVYAESGFPAVADPDVFRALVDAATALKVRFRAGVTATVETFHLSQGRRGFRPLPASQGVHSVRELRGLGILNIEMETSVVLTVARLYGLKAGAVCAVFPDGNGGEPVPLGEENAIRVANEAAVRLALPNARTR